MEICGTFHNRILFLCACVSGFLFALVWRKYEQTVQLSTLRNRYSSSLKTTNYKEWLTVQNMSEVHISEELLRYGDSYDKTNLESSFLYRKIPILCLIFVNSHKSAEAVKNTWSKHCNVVTFFGRFVDNEIPVMKIPPVTSFEGFCYAFTHIYKKYNGLYEWIIIADDNTYAIIENLRYYVAPLNSSRGYYLGHPVKDYSNLYNIGTAGIVLSEGSASLLSSMYANGNDCINKRSPSWYFDQSLGKIFYGFNIHPVDTRDNYDRGRFLPFPAETMLIPGSISVFNAYWRTSAYLSDEGLNCCSDRAITFHGLSPSKMYLMEYLQYHLTVLRNSFQGLGNHPKDSELKQESNEISDGLEQMGEPFIQLLDRDWVRSGKKRRKVKKIRNLWDDLFGS